MTEKRFQVKEWDTGKIVASFDSLKDARVHARSLGHTGEDDSMLTGYPPVAFVWDSVLLGCCYNPRFVKDGNDTDYKVNPLGWDDLYALLRKEYRGKFIHLLRSHSTYWGAHIEVEMQPDLFNALETSLRNRLDQLEFALKGLNTDNIRAHGKTIYDPCVTFDIVRKV